MKNEKCWCGHARAFHVLLALTCTVVVRSEAKLCYCSRYRERPIVTDEEREFLRGYKAVAAFCNRSRNESGDSHAADLMRATITMYNRGDWKLEPSYGAGRAYAALDAWGG